MRDVVVFALRPKLGLINDDWLEPAADPDSDDPLKPTWFLRLTPTTIVDKVLDCSLDPPRQLESECGVSFAVFFDNLRSVGMGWEIDEFGETVPGPWSVSDGYKRNQKLPLDDPNRLPDPNDVKLVPYEW